VPLTVSVRSELYAQPAAPAYDTLPYTVGEPLERTDKELNVKSLPMVRTLEYASRDEIVNAEAAPAVSVTASPVTMDVAPQPRVWNTVAAATAVQPSPLASSRLYRRVEGMLCRGTSADAVADPMRSQYMLKPPPAVE